MVWGVAVMLVLAAASVRADNLHLEMMQEELLGGESYSNYSNSSCMHGISNSQPKWRGKIL